MILSPKQFKKKMEEMNAPYTCPLCGQPGKDKEEREFIEDFNYCYACEKAKIEIQQDCIYDEHKEQQVGL